MAQRKYQNGDIVIVTQPPKYMFERMIVVDAEQPDFDKENWYYIVARLKKDGTLDKRSKNGTTYCNNSELAPIKS